MSPNRGGSNSEQTSNGVEQKLARARHAARWVGMYIPLLLTLVAVVLLVVWLPRMPDPMVRQWGFDGEPSSFGPAWMNLAVSAGFGLGMIALFALIPSLEAKKADAPMWGWAQRFLAAMSLGTLTLIQVLAVYTAWVQVDLEDAREAPSINAALGIGFGIALVLGLVGWFVQPKLNIPRSARAAVDALPLLTTERAVWLGEVRPSKQFVWTMGFSILVMIGSTALVLATESPLGIGIMMVVLTTAIVILGIVGAWFRVRIDQSGLEARSIAGWPVFRLPASEVQRVEAAQINPFSEFGGWGWRWGPDRFGLVMRAGEGIVATRKNGRIFAITLDDAEHAAAALLVAAERTESERHEA